MATTYRDPEGMLHTISETYPCIRDSQEGMMVVVDRRGKGSFFSKTMDAEEVPEYIEKWQLVKLYSD